MSKALATVNFDYGRVDKDTKGKLISYAGQVKRHSSSLKDAANEIGKVIYAVHELLADQKAGLFDEWVELETEVSLSTAYNYINVEKRAFQFPILENLPPTVAYMLAGPKVPDAAIEAFEKRIEKGEKATVKAAKATLNKFRKVAAKPRRKKGMAVKSQETAVSADPIGDACTHEADEDGDCKKCGCPMGGVSGGTTFDTAELDTPDDKVLDGLKQKPPKELIEVFKILPDFAKQRNAITQIKRWITQTVSHPGAKVLEGVAQSIKVDLDNADRALRFARPHSICVYCKNKLPKLANCNACKGHGWITELTYDQAPKDQK